MRSKLNTNLTAENRSFQNSYLNKLTADIYSSALSRVIKSGNAKKKAKKVVSSLKETPNGLITKSLKVASPLPLVFDLFDQLDNEAQIHNRPERYQVPSGVFKATIVGVHKADGFGEVFFFLFDVEVPNFGNTFFATSTPTFKNSLPKNRLLPHFIQTVHGGRYIANADEKTISNMIGYQCCVLISPDDCGEQCIHKTLPLENPDLWA